MEDDMCGEKKGKCEHPERLGDRRPGDCPPEQIEECHGKAKKHQCCEEDDS
jgi:hypothetical protein